MTHCYGFQAIPLTVSPPIVPPLTLERACDQAICVSILAADQATRYANLAIQAPKMIAIDNALNIAHRAARRANEAVHIASSIVMEVVMSQPLDLYSSDSDSDDSM